MDKKDIIIDAAKKAFRQYGIFKTTLEDIGYKCGMKKNSLYYYYKNKDELLRAVTHSEYCDFIEMQLEFVKTELPIKEKMKKYFLFRLAESVKFFTDYDLIKMENQLAYHNIFHEEGDFLIGEELRILNLLLEGKLDSTTDMDSLIMMITSINQGLLYKQLFMNRSESDVNAEIDSIIHILFNGIKTI